jgi:hypothetical protein
MKCPDLQVRMLIDSLEEIVGWAEEAAREEGFHEGHRRGYWKGILTTMVATVIANYFLLAPFLGKKLFPFEATNFTQCLAVRPEQACSAYCNSPTFLR